jgi:hypothetical protein
MPALYSILANSYRAKRLRLLNEQDICQELHYRLQLCRNSDPILHPTDWDPTLVTNQFMLAMLLHQIASIKKNPEAIPELRMERYEVGLVYKYYMMKVAKHGVKSHGDESVLASAVKARVYEEAAMVEGEGLRFA